MGDDGIKALPKSASAQLRHDLMQAIGSGELSAGDRLPTSRELGRQYGISHVAAAQAIERLVADGLVVKQRGAGTFVAEHKEASTDVVRIYERVARVSSKVAAYIESWNAAHPELQVTYVEHPESADLRVMDASCLDRNSQPQMLRPLTGLAPSNEELDEQFHAFMMPAVRDEVHTYAMPLTFSPEVLAYNRRLIGSAADCIDYWTLDELLGFVRENQMDFERRGIRTCSVVERFRYQNFPYLPAFGAAVVDPACRRCLLDTQESIDAISYVRQLATMMAGQAVGEKSNVVNLLRGELAIKNTPSLIFERIAKEPDFALAPFPSGKFPGGRLTGTWIGITAWCRQPEHAWRIIDYLSGPDVQQQMASRNTLFPARRESCVSLLNRHNGRLDAIYRSAFLPTAQATGLSGRELGFIDHRMKGWWNCSDLAARLQETATLVNARLFHVEDELDDVGEVA